MGGHVRVIRLPGQSCPSPTESRNEAIAFGDSLIAFRDSQRSHSAGLAAGAALAGQLRQRSSLGWLYCPRLRQLLCAGVAESENAECPVPPRLLWRDVLLRPLCDGSHGGQSRRDRKSVV